MEELIRRCYPWRKNFVASILPWLPVQFQLVELCRHFQHAALVVGLLADPFQGIRALSPTSNVAVGLRYSTRLVHSKKPSSRCSLSRPCATRLTLFILEISVQSHDMTIESKNPKNPTNLDAPPGWDVLTFESSYDGSRFFFGY